MTSHASPQLELAPPVHRPVLEPTYETRTGHRCRACGQRLAWPGGHHVRRRDGRVPCVRRERVMSCCRIIGLAGRKGSGKTTAARALVDHAATLVTPLNFADPLKRMLRVFLTAEQTDGDQKEQPIDWLDGVTPRRLMQTLGTEWGRDTVRPDFWIKLWERQAADLLSWAGTVVVVADVRFPNEVAAVRSLGGKVIWIDRSAAIADQHVSERQLEYTDCDGLLLNASTVESLAREVVHMARAWGALR